MPTSFGLIATWVTQLIVIRLRRPPARVPTTYNPDGIDHRHPTAQAVVVLGVSSVGDGPIDLVRRAHDDGPGPVAPSASNRASAFT